MLPRVPCQYQYGENVLEVTSFGQYVFNGIGAADLEDVGGIGGYYKIAHVVKNEKQHRFEIHITKDRKIVLSNIKGMVDVKIDGATKEEFVDSSGILGSVDTFFP